MLFIRHSERMDDRRHDPQWIEHNRSANDCVPITPAGVGLAVRVGQWVQQYLSARGTTRVDAFISSPAMRCLQTAQAIAGVLGAQYTLDDGATEALVPAYYPAPPQYKYLMDTQMLAKLLAFSKAPPTTTTTTTTTTTAAAAGATAASAVKGSASAAASVPAAGAPPSFRESFPHCATAPSEFKVTVPFPENDSDTHYRCRAVFQRIHKALNSSSSSSSTGSANSGSGAAMRTAIVVTHGNGLAAAGSLNGKDAFLYDADYCCVVEMHAETDGATGAVRWTRVENDAPVRPKFMAAD
jgi:phosphohistidine phosphatase SixA